MFLRLATATKSLDGAKSLVRLHPAELTALLEQAWNLRVHVNLNRNPEVQTGQPNHRSNIPGIAIPELPVPVLEPPSLTGKSPTDAKPFSDLLQKMRDNNAADLVRGVWWDHLIYAYMIGNTRIRPIFRRVVYELLHGEKFGAPSSETQLWLRNTEELFFRDTPPFSITTISSHIRPNIEATERQAYYRMFGMDLNHGNDDNSPFPYVKVDTANKEFVATFEELLRETWIGHINHTNKSGSNPTDNSKIEELARSLKDMLLARRQNGNLSREEFYLVAMMSWFHLTVKTRLPITDDLRVQGTSPEQRLFTIAQMVGLPAHGLSRSYFEIAESISEVLITIETGVLGETGAARAFYDPTFTDSGDPSKTNTLPDTMSKIITHWSVITGHDVKAGKVAVR